MERRLSADDIEGRTAPFRDDFTAEEQAAVRKLGRSCGACVHFDTCAIWRGVGQQLTQLYGQGDAEGGPECPVKLFDLAWICKAFRVDTEKARVEEAPARA